MKSETAEMAHRSIAKQLQKTRIKCDWPSIERLALRLAPLRMGGVVELFTDNATMLKITREFAKHHKLRVSLPKPSVAVSPLGFRYSSFRLGDQTICELRVVTDEWFDLYRQARRRRGWRSALAFAVDWSDVNIETCDIGDKKRHRIVYFK